MGINANARINLNAIFENRINRRVFGEKPGMAT